MFPQIIFFGRSIGVYALIAAIGGIVCGFLFCRIIRKKGLDDNDSIIFLLFVMLGVLVGGHILYGLVNIRYIPLLLKAADFNELMEILTAIFGGSVFYGGLIGGIAAGYIVIRIMHLNLTVYSDYMAPIVPLFHGVARIGCFFGGCCYGIESKFGFTAYNNPFVPGINDVSRFPVQLLESACNFALSAILFAVLKKSTEKTELKGKIFRIYLIMYSCIRFFDEFLRGDDIRGFIGVLSVSQFISVVVFIICCASLFRSSVARQKKSMSSD